MLLLGIQSSQQTFSQENTLEILEWQSNEGHIYLGRIHGAYYILMPIEKVHAYVLTHNDKTRATKL